MTIAQPAAYDESVDSPSGAVDDDAVRIGARNCVRLGGAARDEEVVIIGPSGVDATVVEALVLAVRAEGAQPVVVAIDPSPRSAGLSPAHAALLAAAPLSITLGAPPGHTREGFLAIFDHGSRQIAMLPETWVLASEAAQFPLAIFFELADQLQQTVRACSALRMTDDRGSELTISPRPGDVGGFIGSVPFRPGPAVPGYVATFPPGSAVWGDLAYTANGRLVLDAALGFAEFSEPMTLTIVDGWVRDVVGGTEATAVREEIFGRRNGNRFAEMGFGLNPKAGSLRRAGAVDPHASVIARSRRAGSVFVAIGGDHMQGGVDAAEGNPVFGVSDRLTVRGDDVVIIDAGRLALLSALNARLTTVANRHGGLSWLEPDS